jgi:hypothetical protein
MLRAAAVFAALVFCSISTAHAAQTERVVAVAADGSMTLATSGAAVLADIYAPQPDVLAQWLMEYALQKEFPFRARGGDDRYGRARVESSLQEDVLNDGAAVFYASTGTISDAWRVAESRAREAKRGVWDERAATVLTTADKADAAVGTFRVVEGSITRIYEAKRATYINFGADWREDFSITIPASLRRSMKPMLQQLKAGQKIRVRGFITQENGPMIRLMHRDNMESR